MFFMIFCFVTLTGNDSDNNANKPIQHLNSDSGTIDTHRNIIHSSTDYPENTTQKLETKRIAPAADKHPRPRNARSHTWSSRFREFNKENNRQLKAVVSNSRTYLENTSGVEACAKDNNDEGNIEIIE